MKNKKKFVTFARYILQDGGIFSTIIKYMIENKKFVQTELFLKKRGF